MMRTPYFSVWRGGVEVSAGWKDLIIAAEITDEAEGEGDTLMIELDDRDGQIEAPDTGDIVQVKAGYREDAEAYEGEFEIDQVDFDGWPQKVVLHGSSSGAKAGTKERRTKAYQPPQYKTYGDIFDEIAQRNKWKSRIGDELRNRPLTYEAQQEESDMAFGTRIAAGFDFQVNVKSRNLVSTQRGAGKSVSGAELPGLPVALGDNLMRYRVSWKSKPKHGKVEAGYFDRGKAEMVVVSEGDGKDAAFRFREPFASEDEAKRAVAARKRELARGEGSASFEIEGNVLASSQIPVEASGIRPRVDGRWNTKRANHRWTTQGFITSLECESPGSGAGKSKGGKASKGKEHDPYWDDDKPGEAADATGQEN